MDCLVDNIVSDISPELLNIVNNSSDDDDEMCIIRRKVTKSQTAISGSDENESVESNHDPNTSQGERIKNKRKKLKQKFFNLLTVRNNDLATEQHNDINKILDNTAASMESDEEEPQKEKTFKHTVDPSIYDKSSDEDDNDIGQIKKSYQEISKSRTYRTTNKSSNSPKCMTAKKAIENMQKIKSESNRMLREKDVSLPYHRPKAMSLKDIMNRRKPALTSDGKSLPLKMNEDQLRQYAVMLEQRQKEMIELYKSESEDEEAVDESENVPQESKAEDEILPNIELQQNKDDENQIENNFNDNADGNLEIKNNTNFENNDENIAKESKYCFSPGKQSAVEIGDEVTNNSEIKGCEENTTKNESKRIEENTNNCETKGDTNNFESEDNKENANDCETEGIIDKCNKQNKDDSQLLSLYYTDDTEKIDSNDKEFDSDSSKNISNKELNETENQEINNTNNISPNNSKEMELIFSDDDFQMEDIDKMIEEADNETKIKPKLIGAPGMVINLDDDEPILPNKTGVQLLKERFTYFSKLKTPEEMERENDKRIKPGTQHLKLKQELGDIIAEQRSLEWSKRLEEEKQKHLELKEIRGETSDIEDDDIDKVESKLNDEECNEIDNKDDLTSEEELIEDDVDMTDKNPKSNPLIEDEADESDRDENYIDNKDFDNINNDIDLSEDESSSEDDTSDESDSEQTTTAKKGRILRAFEDSDEDDNVNEEVNVLNNENKLEDLPQEIGLNSSLDEDLPSAQLHHSISEDIFTSQGTATNETLTVNERTNDLGSQNQIHEPNKLPLDDGSKEKVPVICDSQPYDDAQFDNIVGMCSGSFSQNLVPTQLMKPQDTSIINDDLTEDNSQALGDDVLALCTGKFYDNEFLEKPVENNEDQQKLEEQDRGDNDKTKTINTNGSILKENNLLQSILQELGDPEFDKPKRNKYFINNNEQEKEINKVSEPITVEKKRFVIESDEEEKKPDDTEIKRRKKLKKKRPAKRALQISDDEEDDELDQEDDDLDGEMEDGICDGDDNEVEYDSEENEVEIHKPKTKKSRQFFEDEAELTSEDEWAGSNDEDEAGLDRMEAEAGDQDHFHQGVLQRGLAKIHMRDVLDQDKREVRMIQELLFEDGDLGEGSRQRKFRWKDVEGSTDMGPETLVDEFGDTQVEELESDEHWRRERHKRDMFLRQLKQEEDESPNVSINRSMIVKANLNSKTMSSLLLEVSSTPEKTDTVLEVEKKPTKDVPSPVKKPFQLLQNCRGSMLSRGNNALSRLSSLVTRMEPDPALATAPHRNYVFTAISPNTEVTTKRKAESNPATPSLLKKFKTEEKKEARRSLLDHMNL